MSMSQPDLGEPALWHVTLTVSGEPVNADGLRDALERLAAERPFMVSVRYGMDRAELRYWDEADDIDDAAALALRLWGDHRASAHLPDWHVVGLEVLDRPTMLARGEERQHSPLVATGVRPL
jgi:hypothetical protein